MGHMLMAISHWWCGAWKAHLWRRYSWGVECIDCGKVKGLHAWEKVDLGG